jgi:hypothetical protein
MNGSREAGLRSGRTVAFALLTTLVALAAWLVAGSAAVHAVGEPRMALNARGDGVTCDSAEPQKCTVPLGGNFTLAVEFLEPPAEGYIAVSTQLSLGGLTYLPGSVEAENVWPDNQLPVRAPTPPGQIVAHGGLTGLTAPFPVSRHEGSIVELTLQCSPDPDTFTADLITLSGDSPLGASYALPSQETIPAKESGSIELDLNEDGTPEPVPTADSLDINCEDVPPTPTPGPGDGDGTPSDGAAPTATILPEELPATGAGNGNALNGDGDGVALWLIIGAISAAAAAILGLLAWRYTQIRRAG